ncbi:MAG: hypothetical protein LBQ52_05985, partial [Helicobacteraceae bacterium]|nr:hypothetical protein [Helicobacteraceae bacterium]
YKWIKAALIVVAILLSIATYFIVERPIRFGKTRKGLKAVGLAVALIAIGGVGAGVWKSGGLAERASLDGYIGNKQFLEEITKWPQFYDEDCKRYVFEMIQTDFIKKDGEYCRYKNANGNETVALIGDSHAAFAFDKVAEYSAALNVSAVMFGMNDEQNPANGRVAKLEYANNVFRVLEKDETIKKVFIITRGAMYIHGQRFVVGDFAKQGAEDFRDKLQTSVDRLNAAGKKVYILAENPELPSYARTLKDMLPIQPLQFIQEKYSYKQEVLDKQKVYLETLNEIKGATIIHVIDAFCPSDKCLLLDESGLPLYRDNDHLSVNAGGRFIVEKVLKPYLDE